MSAVALPPSPRPVPANKSLRRQGLIAALALLAYLLGSVVYLSFERARIRDSVEALETLSRHDKALALAEAAVGGAVVDASEASSAGTGEPAMPSEIVLYMESCAKLFAALDEFDPGYALLQRAIARSYDALREAPGRANWIDLRESLGRAAADLEIRRRNLSERRDEITSAYQRGYEAVTIESLALAVVGFVVFGSLLAWFFTRLARDIRALEAHARQIVRGSRGVDLPVQREDELGRLMQAVNRMSADLDEREKQIELDGERRSHQDKMLAVGALAAGFAHEVNNPLAIISGVAQEMKAAEAPPTVAALAESAELILSQAARASLAARQLAEAAAPHPGPPDWIDLNAVVRRVVQLNGYDRRYRQLQFESRLDADLPALRVSADALQQVLMQLVSLGCEALAAEGRAATVRVHTARDDAAVVIGLEVPVQVELQRVEVQRRLSLCRAVVEAMKAQLDLAQDDGPVWRVTLKLKPGERVGPG